MIKRISLLLAAAALGSTLACADEGMWLFNRLPERILTERYGFKPTQSWLEHIQQSSVRLGGASAEFVSSEGLLMSNHHVGSGAIQRLSTPRQNYMRDGFYASTREEEAPCPGVEARVLLKIEDVTQAVNDAIRPEMQDREAFEARRASMARIEEAASKDSILGEVVTLFQGAEYHLYTYKQYTDLRLVFAPEEQIASFGGDADNFEYPRFDLDICFFRAYENGEPARTEHYLKWSEAGVHTNELVFVSGHPGRTDRLRTISELRYLRDVEFPRALEKFKRIEVLLQSFGLRATENARRARGDLKSAENSRKARDGILAGLLDPVLMAKLETAEANLKALAVKQQDLSSALGAWDRIDKAQKAIAEESIEFDLIEAGTGFNSALFSHARRIIRAAEERAKPDETRLEEYRTPALPTLELGLFAGSPIYADLETVKLGDSLTHLAVSLGPDHPLVKKVLAGKTPRVRAREIVERTRLASASERKQLYQGGLKAIREDSDPMIALATMVDADARRVRLSVEVNREAIRQAQTQLGKVRYALLGPSAAPDATGTLRLSFGTVVGYEEDGKTIPAWTTVAGLFERSAQHKYEPPFDLPEKWKATRKKLNMRTPFNFVCTADIIGGNSGSPVINQSGELVGIIFDSNLQGLVADIDYTDDRARAVAVDARGIMDALRHVYRATPLVDELSEKRSPNKR